MPKLSKNQFLTSRIPGSSKERLLMQLSRIDREWLRGQLWKAYREARKGKRRTEDEYRFEQNDMKNINRLTELILSGQYKPSAGVAFIVEEPVKREIFAAPFVDRVVHHFLFNMINEWWDKRLIYNSFSCRKGKGTMFGYQRLARDIRSVSDNYTKKTWVIKLDLKGYFMSLPRDGLFERIVWGLRHQYPNGGPYFQLLKYLWREIIFDNPTVGVRKRKPLAAWDGLPDDKSLFHTPEGIGIVIGNLSSQLLSNIYLDQLDRFISFQLGYKHYGRYVDDFYLVVPDGPEFEQAKRDIPAIRNYALGLKLKLHPRKVYIQEVSKGVDYLGVVVYPHRIVPGKRFKRNFYRAATAYAIGHGKTESVISYFGQCKHLASRKLCNKVYDYISREYALSPEKKSVFRKGFTVLD